MLLYEKYIDHTLLKPNITNEVFNDFIEEAKKYSFYSVCVNPSMVAKAALMLQGTNVNVCSVVGFPLGANKLFIKVEEARRAVLDGAKEIDYVIDLSASADKDWGKIRREASQIVNGVPEGIVVKAIIETGLHSPEEVFALTKAVTEGGVDFVKTCSGFNGGAATLEMVEIMRNAGAKNIKASGGIKDASQMSDFISSGVKRIGTSNSVRIMRQYNMEETPDIINNY
jgi:deoxyribose-phosphate aldolase